MTDDNTSIHHSSVNQAHNIDLLLFKGAPLNNDPDNSVVILVNNGYVSGFSPERLQPLWVGYRVAGVTRDVDYDRPHLYYDDKRLPEEWQIGPQTFGKLNGIQFHVGHMVPNEVINRQFGRLAQLQTFLMSNMSPQRGTFNTGVWLDLEEKIRNIEDVPKQKDHVWAMAGPIFDNVPETIERDNGLQVPVPSAYYCIVADPFRYPWDRPNNVDIAYFLIPQDAEKNTPLSEYLVDRVEIEEKSKLSFFPEWGSFSQGIAPEISFGHSATRHRLLKQFT